MAVVQNIPHDARPLTTSNSFSAPFSGVYDFAISANIGQVLLPIDTNKIYYFDNISIGGNISSEDFLDAIVTAPTITLRYRSDNQTVYSAPIIINQYFQNKEITCFAKSMKGGDAVLATFSGLLKQTASLVGVNPITITVSFSAYAMDSAVYNAMFLKPSGGR